jgi:hypothetical protein
MKVPNWGPSLDGLDIANIATYVRPNTKMNILYKKCIYAQKGSPQKRTAEKLF